MKVKFNELLRIILYLLLGIIFIIASYTIIINIQHYKSLIGNAIVSEADSNYSLYKNNVILIEEKLSYANKDSKEYRIISNLLDNMKKDGVFRLVPKEELKYQDLYQLNDYYMEELINSWYHNTGELVISEKYQDNITMLANNSKYINSILMSNSLNLYDGKLDNKIDDDYHFILNNYLMYSNIILDICNELGWVNE